MTKVSIPHYKIFKDKKEIALFIDYIEALNFILINGGEIVKTYIY